MARRKKTETAPPEAQESKEEVFKNQSAGEDIPEELLGCQEAGPVYQVAWCLGLRLRAAPNREGTVQTVLPVGTPVEVSVESLRPDGIAAWVAVSAGELSGWVDARYLSRVEE